MKEKKNPKGLLQRSDKIVSRQIAGETLLIPINQTGADLQKIYVLNETGAALWSALEKPVSLEDVVTVLHNEFDAAKETILSEITPLVEDLLNRGFVISADGEPG